MCAFLLLRYVNEAVLPVLTKQQQVKGKNCLSLGPKATYPLLQVFLERPNTHHRSWVWVRDWGQVGDISS